MSQPKALLIDPRAMGQAPLDLQAPVFDAAAIVRAEEALQAMSGSFEHWLQEEVSKVQAARLAAEADGWSDEALARLYEASHDLKGLGATYGCPLATQIAASLCCLIETDAGKAMARRNSNLTRAHVDAVRAVVRDGIRSADHPIGRALLRELEAGVSKLGIALS